MARLWLIKTQSKLLATKLMRCCESGWAVQDKYKINLSDGVGQAVREYQTDVGPADYVLFVDKKAVGVIEAKREEVANEHN